MVIYVLKINIFDPNSASYTCYHSNWRSNSTTVYFSRFESEIDVKIDKNVPPDCFADNPSFSNLDDVLNIANYERQSQ